MLTNDTCVPWLGLWPANPASLLRIMEELSKSPPGPVASNNLKISDLYEMTGQAGDADKVLPTLVKVNPKL